MSRIFLAVLMSATWPLTALANISDDLNQVGERIMTRLQDLASYAPLLLIAVAVVLLFWFLARTVSNSKWLFKHIDNVLLRGLLANIVHTLIFIFGVLVALEILDATALVGAVLGTAGVVGLALGFAFKDVIENYLAGILLSIRQPFANDDFIAVDGQQGKVIRMTSRATILMTLDGNHIRIPNSTVFKSTMTNYTRNPLRRFDFVIGVGTDEDLLAAQQLGVATLTEMRSTLSEPAPSALLEPPGDSSVGVHFYAWVNQKENSLSKAKSEAIRLVGGALDNAGIDMPVPIHRVRFDKQCMSITETTEESKVEHSDNEAACETKPKQPIAAEQETTPVDEIDNQIADERRRQQTAESDNDQGQDLLNEQAPKE